MIERYFPNGISHYLAGGVMLGLAVGVLFLATGRIGGMSTLFSASWSWVSRHPYFQQARFVGSRSWRLVYALGLVLGAAVWSLVLGRGTPDLGPTSVPLLLLAVGGFLAGFGARLSNGCTAGHGICGMASLQLPSMLAVVTFLATAIVTANAVRYLLG